MYYFASRPSFASDRRDSWRDTVAACVEDALYDSGEQSRVAYMVMEFVEGESLASRLKRGKVAVAQH